MFNWIKRIGNYFVANSKLYQEETDRRLNVEKERFELEDRLQNAETEISELTVELETREEEREEKYNLIGLLKSTNSKLERKLQRYAPLEVTYHMIETSDQPCLYLTPDFVILKKNKASQKDPTFKDRSEGENLLDSKLIEEGEIKVLENMAIASTKPFEYKPINFKSKNWSIIPIKENETLFGYILTKKGFLTKFLEKTQELYRSLIGEEESKKIITTAKDYASSQ